MLTGEIQMLVHLNTTAGLPKAFNVHSCTETAFKKKKRSLNCAILFKVDIYEHQHMKGFTVDNTLQEVQMHKHQQEQLGEKNGFR